MFSLDGRSCVYAIFVCYLHPGGDTRSYLCGGSVAEDQVRLEAVHFLIQIVRGGGTHVEVRTMPSECVRDRFAVQDRRYGDKYAQSFADLQHFRWVWCRTGQEGFGLHETRKRSVSVSLSFREDLLSAGRE